MNWYKKAQKLKEVQLKGKLKMTDDGFVYLEINDDLIKGLLPMIDEDDVKKPPYEQKQYNSVGTHVSVMYGDEVNDNDLKIQEVGNEYNFKLGDFKSVNPKGWDEMKKVYFLQIHSEELEKLRKKYDLPAKLNGHEFHITIGVEKAK